MADYFTIYEHKDYNGKQYTVNLDNTTYGVLNSLKSTDVHDNMSSVKWSISANRGVTFYEHTNGTGRTYSVSGTGVDPDTHNNNFKDCASSWRLTGQDSIPFAFSKTPTSARRIRFSKNGHTIPTGGHIQGVQQINNRNLVISGSSNNKAFFFIVNWANPISTSEIGKITNVVNINDDFNMTHDHASGIQLLGNTLAIGAEGGSGSVKSSVVFYNLSNLSSPTPVGPRIDRTVDTAGALGMVQRSSDILLVVGGWDSNRIDFYSLNSQTLAYTWLKKWEEGNKNTSGWIDGNWGSYQGLNLLREADGKLYLVGFNRNGSGEDWVDLYSLDMNALESTMLKKIDKKHVYCNNGASFRWSGGLYAPFPSTNITLWATEKNISTTTDINCFD